jgi:hypothetical protein
LPNDVRNTAYAQFKVKSLCLTKYRAMKTYWASGDIAPRVLNLGIRYWMGKGPWYSVGYKADGPQSQSELGSEEKNSFSLPGTGPQSSNYYTD